MKKQVDNDQMGKHYDHLSYEDRVKIEHWHKDGKSIRFIARELGRSPNTISYKMKNLQVSGEYIAKKAKVKAYQKRRLARTWSNKVARDKDLRTYVDLKLDLGWSPKVIAGRVQADIGTPVSKDVIYRYVRLYALHHKLYFKGKPKRKKTMYRRSLMGDRKWIEERILRD